MRHIYCCHTVKYLLCVSAAVIIFEHFCLTHGFQMSNHHFRNRFPFCAVSCNAVVLGYKFASESVFVLACKFFRRHVYYICSVFCYCKQLQFPYFEMSVKLFDYGLVLLVVIYGCHDGAFKLARVEFGLESKLDILYLFSIEKEGMFVNLFCVEIDG
jgi:hypothetical protein